MSSVREMGSQVDGNFTENWVDIWNPVYPCTFSTKFSLCRVFPDPLSGKPSLLFLTHKDP